MCFETISAKELENYIGEKDVMIVDLRDKGEYDAGHVKGAVNIPYEELKTKSWIFNKYNQVILYCERGNMSLMASRKLSEEGIYTKNVYGGIHACSKKIIS